MRVSVLTSNTAPAPAEPASDLPLRPKVREDLRWLVDHREGGFLVRDGRTGLRMRVRDREKALCQLLDGTRSIEEAARDAERQLGRCVSKDALSRFVVGLAEAGALQGNRGRRRDRLVGIALLNTEAFFTRLDRLLWFWATPAFQAILIALILLGAIFAVGLLEGLTWRHALRFSALEWAVVGAIELMALVAHECAHGLALTRFGGRVGAISVLVLRPLGLVTIDVSDIYSQPKLRQVLVLAAGSEINLLVAAAAVIVARLWPSSPWASVAEFTACAQYFQVLMSMVPFHESDGYYALAAATEMPNLRKVSRQMVATLIKGPAWERTAELSVSPRFRVAGCLLFAVGVAAWRTTVALGTVAALAWLLGGGLGSHSF